MRHGVVLLVLLAACSLQVGCPRTDATPPEPEIKESVRHEPSENGGEVVIPETGLTGNMAGQDQSTGSGAIRTPAEPIAPAFDQSQQSIRLSAARNEVVSFQINIPAGRYESMRLRISDLVRPAPTDGEGESSRIARGDIEMSRLLPVRVSDLPGWYQLHGGDILPGASSRSTADFPDVLLPVDHPRLGQPFNLFPDDRLSLWVDVPVPADAIPGVYSGNLRIETTNLPPRVIAVRVEVGPETLPAVDPLTFLAPIDVKKMLARELGAAELTDSTVYAPGRARDLARRRLEQWTQLARVHGVHLLPADLSPIFRRDLQGKVTVDWEGYDLLLGPHLVGPAAPPVWLAPFRLDYPDATLYGGVEGAAYAKVADEYLREVGRHGELGKWPRPIVWIHRDTPPRRTLPYGAPAWEDWMTPRREAESLTIGRLVRLTELNIGYLETLPWSLKPPGPERPGGATVPPHVSVYCPPARFLDPSLVQPLAEKQQVTAWIGRGDPPWRPGTSVHTSPEQIEALAYLGWRTGMRTVWLGPTQSWPGRSPFEQPMSAASANFLFYPGDWFGQDRPVASLRLKYLRRAAQDYAYLKLLNDANRSVAADAIARGAVKYGLSQAHSAMDGLGAGLGWLTQPAFFTDARTMLRQELELARTETVDSDATQLAQARWQWFMERVAWIRLGLYPSQVVDVLDDAGVPTGNLRAVQRVDCYVDRPELVGMVPADMMADQSTPLLAFGKLPDTWKAERFNIPLKSAPASADPLSLAAEGSETPIDRTGRVAMPLAVRSDEQDRVVTSVPAGIPLLPAHQFRKAPTIDGNLNDWPADSWYRGAGFQRLEWARPVSLYGRPETPPARTWIMVGYDEAKVYLAAACLDEPLDEVRSKASNTVRMDDGLVVNDDAIEFILDPTGGRLESKDLFCLLVKANSVMLARRGAMGGNGEQARHWGRDVRVAVDYRKDGWLAEVSIDLKELAPTNQFGLWRLNAVRHYAARGEHSAWASGHPLVYDARTLGNLLLREPKLPEIRVPLAPVSPLGDIRP